MTEYKLNINDVPEPKSRLVFLKRLEKFLGELRDDGIISGYSLATPYGSTTIFKVKEEAGL